MFRPDMDIGVDVSVGEVRRSFDAMVLCGGARQPRDLQVPGRALDGIHFALDYLTRQNRFCEGDDLAADGPITAAGKRVVILGGGDTGADCVGTAHRQGALSVHQLELMPQPPATRAADNPWPEWPRVFRTSAAHQEGGERWFSVVTERFLASESGRVGGLQGMQVDHAAAGGQASAKRPSTPLVLQAELVLLAMGFTGPERSPLLAELDLQLTDRGTLWRDDAWMTSQAGVFTAGDMQRGQSLIVWAMADGRNAARAVDGWLMTQSELRAEPARREV